MYHQDFHSKAIGYQHPMFCRGHLEILTSFLNGKKKKNKLATSASPEQETLIQGIEACFISLVAPKKTGVLPAKASISTLLVPAATPICAMNALHMQLFQVYRPMATEVTRVNICELLLWQLLQSPAKVQQYKCKLMNLLILQQQQQQQHISRSANALEYPNPW